MDYSTTVYDRSSLSRAWKEWCGTYSEELDFQNGETILFMSWFLAHWRNARKRSALNQLPLAAQYYLSNAEKLSSAEREYLDSLINEPFTFYEILESTQNFGMRLKDMFSGREEFVHERSGSQSAHVGDFVFGKIGKTNGTAILEGMAETLFPPLCKSYVLDLRKQIKKFLKISETGLPTIEQVGDTSEPIHALYRTLRERSKNPTVPQLANTNGEALSFNKLAYDISDPNAVFDALHGLCGVRSKDDLMQDAALDSDGKIVKIEFPWLGQGKSKSSRVRDTVHGMLTIEQESLTVQTNSDERAEKIKDLIHNRAGTLVRFKARLLEPFEPKMEAWKSNPRPPETSHEELLRHPEVHAKMKEIHKSHMDGWVKERIPALGDKTPVQAMKTPEGREGVKALLLQFERWAGKTTGDRDFEVGLIQGIREQLGLS